MTTPQPEFNGTVINTDGHRDVMVLISEPQEFSTVLETTVYVVANAQTVATTTTGTAAKTMWSTREW